MPPAPIEYGHLIEAALRTVVRDVLGRLARDEVPSPHHFYISFRTTHPGVELADYLRERYPNEMTIVLQHQYWDLEVGEESFSVMLSFNDTPERLTIPYEAIKVFADPGVEFGLQFTLEHKKQPEQADSAAEAEKADGGEEATVTPLAAPRPGTDGAAGSRDRAASHTGKKGGGDKTGNKKDGDDKAGEDAGKDEEGEASESGAEIVTLDRFRNRK